MKKAVAYTLLPILILSLAAGCGMADTGKDRPTATPVIPASPEMATPYVGDGMVNDDDGIITEDDNGKLPAPSASADTRPGIASPTASPTATPNV